MKKVFLSIVSIAFLFGTFAQAEVQMDDETFRQAVQRAMIKANIKLSCGPEGQAFANQMASSLKQTSKFAPNVSTENAVKVYEGLCERSIKEALQNNISESQILELFQK